MQVENIQKSIFNFEPPEERIKRGNLVIALSKVEPSNFRKNHQLDFTGPYFVTQIRDKNRLILQHALSGAKLKKSMKLVQKLSVDKQLYSRFKEGLVNMKRGVLQLSDPHDNIESILQRNAENDKKLIEILDKNIDISEGKESEIEVQNRDNNRYSLRQRKKANYKN